MRGQRVLAFPTLEKDETARLAQVAEQIVLQHALLLARRTDDPFQLHA